MAKKKTNNTPKGRATLFDHIKQITSIQDPNYFDKISDDDKKTFSNYMIYRFLSMNGKLIELLAEIQPYVQALEPKQFYLALIGLIPKGNYYSKYIKSKNEDKWPEWLVGYIKNEYNTNKNQSLEYLHMLNSTSQGRSTIKYICAKYGVDKSEIDKLKLKK